MSFKTTAISYLYKVLTIFLAPLGAAFLAYKKRHDPSYGLKFFNLLGFYKKQKGSHIWFHGASVGEINALKPLIAAYIQKHPQESIVVSTMTTTGLKQAQTIKNVKAVISPLDSPLSLCGFFFAYHPKKLFIIDTELWPNLLDKAKKANCPVSIVNARLQDKNVQAYLKHAALVKNLISDKLTYVLCSSLKDASRFEKIGVLKDKIKITGNIKYDLKPKDDLFNQSRLEKAKVLGTHVFGAISIHDNEEKAVIDAYLKAKQKVKDLKLIFVSRHQSTTDLAIKYLNEKGIAFQLRSDCKNFSKFKSDILIGNTLGEIEFYLGLCDLVFMGGSFVSIGGHNPLEPAYFSLPILTGKYYHNFQEQFDKLIDLGGAYLAEDEAVLCQYICKLIVDNNALKKAGIIALDVQQQGRGAIELSLKYMDL